MLPAPPVPALTNDSLSSEEEGSVVDREDTSDQGGGSVGGNLIDDLDHLDDLDVMSGLYVEAFL